jgi:hypothetical protein
VSRWADNSCQRDNTLDEGCKLTASCIEKVSQDVKWSTGLDNFFVLGLIILVGSVCESRFPWLLASIFGCLGQDLGYDALLGRHDGCGGTLVVWLESRNVSIQLNDPRRKKMITARKEYYLGELSC